MEENISSSVIMVNINDILPNRFQPRIEFDEDEILGLSTSIKKHGIINPILVRKISDKYEIIAGERRYKAAVLAGLEKVPVILKDLSDNDSAEIALLENIQRKDMSSIEEAISIQKILDMGYLTQVQLAEQLGKSQSYIANKLRLLKLTDEVQEALLKNKISERHARSLLRLKNSEKQNEMLNKIIEQRLTVRKTDEEIDKMNDNILNNNLELNPSETNNETQSVPTQANQEIIPTSLDSIFGSNIIKPTVEPSVSTEIPAVSQNMDENNKFFSFGTPEPSENTITPNVIGTNEGVNLANEVLSSNNQNSQFNQEIPSTPIMDIPTMPSTPVEPTAPAQPEIPSTPIMDIPTMPSTPVEPTVPVQPEIPSTPIMDIPTMPSTPVEPTVPLQPEIPSTPIMEVPTMASASVEPTVPVQPEIPSTPIMDIPTMPSTPVEPTVPVQPEIPSTPIMEVPTMASAPVEPTAPVQPEIPTSSVVPSSNSSQVETFTLPEQNIPSTPIMDIPTMPNEDTSTTLNNINSTDSIEQSIQSNNSFLTPQTDPVVSTDSMYENNSQTIEPIIITDYNKQYDPIMPEKEPPKPTVDFRQIINLIRDCSDQIEKSGYSIDTEEYDLEGMYQVVFKIDKKNS